MMIHELAPMTVFSLTVALIASDPAAGDVILFDDFGPGDSYDTGPGFAFGFRRLDRRIGFAFTVSGGDYHLERITAPITWFEGANQATLSLHSDNAGEPGDVLDAMTEFDLPTSPGGPPTAFEYAGDALLSDGSTYWVVASALNDGEDNVMAWHKNDQGVEGAFALWESTQGWLVQPSGFPTAAFRVEASPVPAPAPLGVLALMALRPRRRRLAPAYGWNECDELPFANNCVR